MLKKSLLTLSIIASLLLPTTRVCADTYNSDTTTGAMSVSCTIQDTYQVSLPAQLTLSYDNATGNYVGTYTVACKSCLLNGETVVIKPNTYTPELRTAAGYHKVDTVLVQNIDTWTNNPTASNEIQSNNAEFVETTGTITLPRENYKNAPSYTYSLRLGFTFTKTDI